MPIQVPEERAYYYECTGRATRLYYWIPEADLRQLVSKGKANEMILVDYPDGIDVKVSTQVFDDFKSRYGLQLDINPTDVRRAFEVLRLQAKEPFRGSGYLTSEFLEGLAKRVRDDAERFPVSHRPLRLKPDTPSGRKKVFATQREVGRGMQSYLQQVNIPEMEDDESIAQQSFSRVKMTKGEDPREVFNKLQRRKRRRS